jgi:type I restriction enzyme S subunit
MTTANAVSLLDVADLVRGVSYKREEARPEPGLGLVPIVRANNIQDGELLFDELVYVPEGRVDDQQRLREGDIVLAMSSGSPDVVGKAAAAQADWNGGFGAFCAVLRARPGTNWRWLAHFLQSPDYRDAIAEVVTGTNINNLSRTTLTGVRLPLVDEQTQAKVVLVLDRIGAIQRSSRTHLCTARRSIERFRPAVLAAAWSGQLTAAWREANRDGVGAASDLVRILNTTARSRRAELGQRLSRALDARPDSWQTAMGYEVFPFVTSGSRGWARYYSDDGPSFVRVGNLDRYRLDLDLAEVQHVQPPANAETKRTLVLPDDLLISITAEPGMVAIAPPALGEAYVNQHVAIARPHPALNARFLAICVAAPNGGQKQLDVLQRGATKAGLGLDDIRSLMVPLPSAAEQAEIVQRVDQLFALARNLEERIDRAELQIGRSSRAILAKAFRGELGINQPHASDATVNRVA